MTPEEIKRLQQHAKAYHAGTFAVPLPAELAKREEAADVHRFPGGAIGLASRPDRPLKRRDFTGAHYSIPAGVRLLEHLTVPAGVDVPELSAYDFVYAYAEDQHLMQGLWAQGFVRYAVAIAASSSISVVWAQPRFELGRIFYDSWDVATVVKVGEVPERPNFRAEVLAEVKSLSGWKDDFPYYHKGEWGQVVLRGFNRADPYWGVKPSEMSKTWKAAHPEQVDSICDWTVISDRMPATLGLIREVAWWGQLERVRLLRLTRGQLTRHTDITDRTAGTRSGMIARFHIPLQTSPDVVAKAWGLDGQELASHWDEWGIYYLDQRKPHAAINPSQTERIHLVVDVVAGPAVRERISQSL